MRIDGLFAAAAAMFLVAAAVGRFRLVWTAATQRWRCLAVAADRTTPAERVAAVDDAWRLGVCMRNERSITVGTVIMIGFPLIGNFQRGF